MSMNRFDNRDKKQFKKDIKFGTLMEQYWIERFKESANFYIQEIRNNGADNSGEFIESGKSTFGADYYLTGDYNGPLEVKWAPTFGKITLKIKDIRAYKKEKAGILFVLPAKKLDVDLRKPKDHDFEKHIKRIEQHLTDIRWGIMMPQEVASLEEKNKERIKPIKYMGNKMGIIIPESEFYQYFTLNKFKE